jgi:hypothetical protein
VVTKQRLRGGESAAVCLGTVVTACFKICSPINIMNVRASQCHVMAYRLLGYVTALCHVMAYRLLGYVTALCKIMAYRIIG